MAETKTDGLSRKIEMAANVAIVLAALGFLFMLAERYLLRAQVPPPAQIVGTTLSLGNVHWSPSKDTVVLAISTECRFCNASSGFYRQLTSRCGRAGVRTIAVMPQPVAQARSYLSARDISVDEVSQENLPKIGVYATPTLLAVDRKGVVRKEWVGELTKGTEDRVVNGLCR